MRTHISRTLGRLDRGLGVTRELPPLRWTTDSAEFTRTVQANFGQFAVAPPPPPSPSSRPRLLTPGDGGPSPMGVARPAPPTEITVSNSSAAQLLHEANVIESRDGPCKVRERETK